MGRLRFFCATFNFFCLLWVNLHLTLIAISPSHRVIITEPNVIIVWLEVAAVSGIVALNIISAWKHRDRVRYKNEL
jgi:hypothetical protein